MARLILGLAALAIGSDAIAQGPPCGPRKALTKKLEQAYAEARQGVGLMGGKILFEVWASASGSWTVLLTRPDGTSCVMAVGEVWQWVEQVKGEPS